MTMKITIALSMTLILLAGFMSSAQIGVNTNSPTANLDVNGTLRVRSLEKTANGFEANGVVLYIMGVDESGNVIPIEIGENIILEDNKLKVQLPEEDSSVQELPNGGNLSDNYSNGSDDLINDLDLGIVILPGGGRSRWPVIRLPNDNDDKVEITGIKALPDGTMVYLYPTSGDIELKKNDNDSQTKNRFAANKNYKVKKNEFVQLMYDGSIERWVIVTKETEDDD